MLLRGFARFRMRILQSNQVFVLQPLQGRGIAGHEFAFAMTDRHRQHAVDSQSFGENTRAVGVRLELDPSVLIAGGVVMAEGNLPLKTLPVQRGEYAELDEQLESVADSQHEAARIDEPVQAVQQRLAFRVGKMQPALCRGLCRPEIVAIKESAGENKELILAQADLRSHNVGKMHHISPVRTGQTCGMRCFLMRVGAVSGNDQRVDLTHCPPFSCIKIKSLLTEKAITRLHDPVGFPRQEKKGASLEWGIYFMRVFLFSQWLFFF